MKLRTILLSFDSIKISLRFISIGSKKSKISPKSTKILWVIIVKKWILRKVIVCLNFIFVIYAITNKLRESIHPA